MNNSSKPNSNSSNEQKPYERHPTKELKAQYDAMSPSLKKLVDRLHEACENKDELYYAIQKDSCSDPNVTAN